MPAVFVHGVPDTQHVWDAVVWHLHRKDVLTLSLSGFGRQLPDGFSATKEVYVDWLLGQLAALQGPIDLVGHGWGGLLAVRAVSVRTDAVRSGLQAGRRWIDSTCGIEPREAGRRPGSGKRRWPA